MSIESLSARINESMAELRAKQEAEARRLLATLPPGKRVVIEVPRGRSEFELGPMREDGGNYVCTVRWLGRFKVVNANDEDEEAERND